MKALILAGGKGTRLWPLSRENYPKQFLSIGQDCSLLQDTVRRISNVIPYQDIFVITNHANFHDVAYQLSNVSPVFRNNIIIEPMGKNTAPAISWGVKYVKETAGIDDDEVFFVTPSDHHIVNEEKFSQYLKMAEQVALQGNVVTFGIAPTAPETGYGYIKKGKALKVEGAFIVDKFVEKPDEATAKKLVNSGCHYWNSGMFSFTTKTIMQELQRHAPEIHEAFKGNLAKALECFSDLPNISFDYAVMEKSQCAAVLPVTLEWSDIGNWDSWYNILEKDENNNARRGDVITEETSGCLILGNSRLISTVGLKDVLIVDTPDALCVAKKGSSQRVQQLVKNLKEAGRSEIMRTEGVQLPWGSSSRIEKGNGFLIQHLSIKPGGSLTLQMNPQQVKHWVFVQGTAKVTIDNKTQVLRQGQSISMTTTAVHKVENIDGCTVEIIETRTGSNLEDSDIISAEGSFS